MIATIPIGTLIRKIQRQETSSTSQPPRIGPTIGATSIGTPRIPITRPIRCGPAFLVMIVMTAGHDHAAADALQDAEGDQRVGAPGDRAEREPSMNSASDQR